jgi:hypothetical protein
VTPVPIFLTFVLGLGLLVVLVKLREARRIEFIRNFKLPPGLYDKLRAKHPHLSQKDCELTGHALRQFFLAYLKSNRQNISMPSQVVDDLWHEFILYTRNYQIFCRRAFGVFLHHTPAAAFSEAERKPEHTNDALRRCWYQACREEHINPLRPTRLPLLFALDRKLSIQGGFVYVLNCRSDVEVAKVSANGLPVHCAADLKPLHKRAGAGCSAGGCSSGSGGHGCSGGGCGGGCGGS